MGRKVEFLLVTLDLTTSSLEQGTLLSRHQEAVNKHLVIDPDAIIEHFQSHSLNGLVLTTIIDYDDAG